MTQAVLNEVRTMFESPDTYASTMVICLVDKYGVEAFEWDPDSIRLELYDVYSAEVPQANLDKINAALLAITTNQFYVSLEAFMSICNALFGYGVGFHAYDPAEIDEMCWGITEIMLLAPSDDKDPKQMFSNEIRYYIGQRAEEEGFSRLPKPLNAFAVMTDQFKNTTSGFEDTDPEMFAAYWSTQQDSVKEVESMVKSKLKQLFTQIEQLPLQNGDSESWKEFSGRGLRVPRRNILLGTGAARQERLPAR